jgi:hypothetical protein
MQKDIADKAVGIIIQGKLIYYVVFVFFILLVPQFYLVQSHIEWLGIPCFLGFSFLVVGIKFIFHLKHFLRWYGVVCLGMFSLFGGYGMYISSRFDAQFNALYTIPGITIQASGNYQIEWTNSGFTEYKFFLLSSSEPESSVQENIRKVLDIHTLQKPSDLSWIDPKRPEQFHMELYTLTGISFTDSWNGNKFEDLLHQIPNPEETFKASNFMLEFVYDLPVPN